MTCHHTSWHDRSEQRHAAERPQYYFEIYNPVDLRVRRLELSMIHGFPIIPPSQLASRGPEALGLTPMDVSGAPPVSPQRRDASPMSVASTVPADFDFTLQARRLLQDFPDHDSLLTDREMI